MTRQEYWIQEFVKAQREGIPQAVVISRLEKEAVKKRKNLYEFADGSDLLIPYYR